MKPLPFATMTVRLSNLLRSQGIETYQQLAHYDYKDLLDIRNFGATMLVEVRKILAREGLKLRIDNPKLLPRPSKANTTF